MHILSGIATVLVLTLLASCGDGGTEPSASIAGTYRLESINASPLPYEFFGVAFVSGSLTLSGGGTYSSESVTRPADGGANEAETSSGTYARSGNVVHFTESGTGDQIDGTYDGRRLTMDAGLIVLVYRR